VQRSLATGVIGGLLISTPFTLYVSAAIIYSWLSWTNGDHGQSAVSVD
jgi:multidrug efflux pump subunit AcrB